MNKVQHAASRRPAHLLADRHTPLVHNCWYVAGFAGEFTRELRARTILGKPLVLFRSGSGIPVALDDRCPHRSFPLSRSRLDGDTIVCGYHGLRYDCAGNCVEVPSMERVPPGISVRRYPLVERGHLVWIWMGDPESADASAIPRQEWITDPGWTSSQGYFHLSSNYVGLHENLLDLTHLSYLHADTFGTSDYARAPFEAEIGAGSFAVHRKVVPTFLPPIWAKPTGLGGVPAARIVRSEFLSPALHVVNVRFHAADVPESQCPDHQIKTAHIVTPELQDSTHYFFYHARNFARDDDAVTEFMHERLSAAFREDVEGLEAIARLARSWPDSAPPEISIASDKAGVAMRHYLKRLADSEAQTPAVT